jgi:hypothetical protein
MKQSLLKMILDKVENYDQSDAVSKLSAISSIPLDQLLITAIPTSLLILNYNIPQDQRKIIQFKFLHKAFCVYSQELQEQFVTKQQKYVEVLQNKLTQTGVSNYKDKIG